MIGRRYAVIENIRVEDQELCRSSWTSVGRLLLQDHKSMLLQIGLVSVVILSFAGYLLLTSSKALLAFLQLLQKSKVARNLCSHLVGAGQALLWWYRKFVCGYRGDVEQKKICTLNRALERYACGDSMIYRRWSKT